MIILSRHDYTNNQDVRDAIATLLEYQSEGEGLGYYQSYDAATGQSCLVILAFGGKDVARVVDKLSIVENSQTK